MPALALHYSNAQKHEFGPVIKIGIGKNLYKRFREFEDNLRAQGIPSRDYAYGVTRILKKWVKEKGLTCVPVKTFLGDWAFDQYLDVHKSKTVILDNVDKDKDSVIFYNEAMLAKLYIIRKTKDPKSKETFADIVWEVEPTISKDWLEMYNNNNAKREKVVAMVMEMFRKTEHIGVAKTYDDIIRIKNGR